MEILELIGVPHFKKGKGIHIKKKNRGKFTEYCGGKVTQECIDKAKKNKNPTLRKRAVFAENARKWKHQEGGTLKVQEGATTSSERTPTLEEYIQMKLQEARQRALANSYNTTEPRLAKRYYTKEDIEILQSEITDTENFSDKYDKFAEETEKKLKHPFIPEHLFIFNPIYRNAYTDTGLNNEGEELLKTLSSDRAAANEYKNYVKEYQDRLDYINKHGYDWTGPNCITNATGWYGDPYVCASNVELKKDPSKYGFVEINPDNALPGDIFQYDSGGIPNHAVMYSKKGDDGKYYTNYSNGSHQAVVKHDSDYWGKGERAFRFVGLPKDIEAWTQKYNELYGKKFGGVLGEFKEGGILKTQEGTPKYGLPGGLLAYMVPQPGSPIDIMLKQAVRNVY